MAETTGISWTARTLNFWRGCSHVSPGCWNCYMFALARRSGWDPTRVARTKRATWNRAYEWDRRAAQAGRRDKVFVCSLSDFFHNQADAWRDDAWRLFRA